LFNKILIANRGEIACRIIKTCRKLKIKTVAVYSEADQKGRHVKLADEAYLLGAASPQESYLNLDRILDAARTSGADAIHPGYGFLSENPAFAAGCEDAGIKFIGPSPDTIEKMGDKLRARKLARQAGLPVLPGTDDAVEDHHAVDRAWELGFPLMVKASEGGGGIGIHVIETMDQLLPLVERTRKVSASAFGSSRLFFERYLQGASHIEVQLIGDQQGNLVHLYERDCSMQRRNQKLIEESPAVKLNPQLRQKLCGLAMKLARHIGYTNAGTVEFLVSSQGQIYFLEMNTRLQVEHGVTEMVTGLDLVELQIRVACGESLPITREVTKVTGHAIQARVYPEDPDTFMPDVGVITGLHLPTGRNLRVDTALCKGYEVTLHYEPLLAKVMAWGKNRPEAIKRLHQALLAFRLDGVKSNIPLLRDILTDRGFGEATHHTGSLSALAAARTQLHHYPGVNSRMNGNGHEKANRETAAAIGVALALAMQASGSATPETSSWRVIARREQILSRTLGSRGWR
jgi:acetyl-CoA carboxylase biotin carboxylase subunit